MQEKKTFSAPHGRRAGVRMEARREEILAKEGGGGLQDATGHKKRPCVKMEIMRIEGVVLPEGATDFTKILTGGGRQQVKRANVKRLRRGSGVGAG